MAHIKLVVGLGNPGTEYAKTRHNAGFWWVDRLCASHGFVLKPYGKFFARVARFSRCEHDVWLMEPQTSMNVSGRAVSALARFYRIAVEEVLVVHDEIDLPPGTVRLKQGGGHAGHNGLRDIVAHLGSADFWRLRLGIGHPGLKSEVVNYVLQRPTAVDQELIDSAIEQSLNVWPQILSGDFGAAMMKLHTRIPARQTPADDFPHKP